jgi:SNF family Na+-dependent transporter
LFLGGNFHPKWSFQNQFQAVVSVGVLLSFFYNVVVSWSIWYLLASVTSYPVEWSSCDHDFNSDSCYSKFQDKTQCHPDVGNASATFLFNGSCMAASQICQNAGLAVNAAVLKCLNGSGHEVLPEVLLDR